MTSAVRDRDKWWRANAHTSVEVQQRIVAAVHGDRVPRRIAMTQKPAKPAAPRKRAKTATAAEPAKPGKRAAAATGADPAKPATRAKRATATAAAEPAKRAPRAPAMRAKPAARRASVSAPGTNRRRASYDEICERAYFISLEQGGGDEVANWLRAERELATP